MLNKGSLENSEILGLVPDSYKNQQQQIWDKAVEMCHCDYYMTQKMCDKADNTYHCTINLFLIAMAREIYDKVVDRCFFAFIYIPD